MTVTSTPRLPHPLPEALVELIARRFQVIGEPTRIRLLDRLRDGEATVQELTMATAASQQNVSKHLHVLREAGIVARRKAGTHVYYRVADEGVFELCESVCGSVQQQLSELNALLAGGLPA
jgi:DNA-binding transcriptional ArsR family regulator